MQCPFVDIYLGLEIVELIARDGDLFYGSWVDAFPGSGSALATGTVARAFYAADVAAVTSEQISVS